MKENFRQSMAWLHTWAGLWLGWVLFAIFFTGSLGVFDDAISHWMQAKPAKAEAASLPPRAEMIERAQARLAALAPHGHYWGISLPSPDNDQLRIYWAQDEQSWDNRRLDPHTGADAAGALGRETEGGHLFVGMHYEFHAGMAGVWLVGVATMAMLLALVSGVVTHKRIFKDFFTFRPGKGQRSWLDAHNAVAVLTLPFQLMIAYTGLVIFYATYLPAGIAAQYGSETPRYWAELLQRPHERPETGIPAQPVPLAPLHAQAEARLGKPADWIGIEHPGDTSAMVSIDGRFHDEEASAGRLRQLSAGEVHFEGVSGVLVSVQPARTRVGGTALQVQQVMNALHYVQFGGAALKWLYFLCGMMGAAMMATGLLLFTVKRQKKSAQEFGAATPRVYRIVEVLNVGAVTGLIFASVGVLWANRLIPEGLAGREHWEERVLFALWALAAVHAALRPGPQAWREQLTAIAVAGLLLPLMSALVVGDHLFAAIARGDGEWAGVELVVIVFSLAAGATAWWLRRRASRPQPVRAVRAPVALEAQP